jgi:hypothetical protein
VPRLADDDIRSRVAQEAGVLHGSHDRGDWYRISTGMVTKKQKLTPVSTPELVFSDQKVGSLVVVAESPNIGAAIWVSNFSPNDQDRQESLTPSGLL